MPLSDEDRTRLKAHLDEVQVNVTAARDLLDAIELNVNACREILEGQPTASTEADGDYGGGEGGSTGGGGGGGPVRTP